MKRVAVSDDVRVSAPDWALVEPAGTARGAADAASVS